MSARDDIRWMVLLKFGDHKHLEEFRRDGLLYMNSQHYFANLEGDVARGDPFEGTDQIHQSKDIKHVRIENDATGHTVMIKSEDMAGPLSICFGKEPPHNIFCMYAVTKPVDGPFVDERALKLGDSFVLVLNTQDFMRRICKAAKSAGFGYAHGLINYYDEDHYSGETGPFRKSASYAYQQEFRFLIRPGSHQPIRLLVGSLEDITTPVHSLSQINQIVDFGSESARQAGLV